MSPQPQMLINQPVPQATLIEEAKEFQIFVSNAELTMRTATREENKLYWGGCYKFFPEDSDGRHIYASRPFRSLNKVREYALPFLRRFRQKNGSLNRRVSSLLPNPGRLTAAFYQPSSGHSGITKNDLDDLQKQMTGETTHEYGNGQIHLSNGGPKHLEEDKKGRTGID